MTKQQEVQSVCEGIPLCTGISPVLEQMSREPTEEGGKNLRLMKGDGVGAGGAILHQARCQKLQPNPGDVCSVKKKKKKEEEDSQTKPAPRTSEMRHALIELACNYEKSLHEKKKNRRAEERSGGASFSLENSRRLLKRRGSFEGRQVGWMGK